MAPSRIFIVASDKDRRHVDILTTFLASSERKGLVDVWHRDKIAPGVTIRDEVERNLTGADVFAVLLSADLLNEQHLLLQRVREQRQRGAMIIPIRLRPVVDNPFADEDVVQLPKEGKPISTRDADQREEAWAEVVQALLSAKPTGAVQRDRPPARQDQPPAQRDRPQPPGPRVVLMLTANPSDAASSIKLEEERAAIEDEFIRARHRDGFDLRQSAHVTPVGLQQAVVRYRPIVAHVSSHGTAKNELVMIEQDTGVAVPQKGVIDLFRIMAPYVRGVVLVACYSDQLAKGISEHVKWAIGVEGELDNSAAVSFSGGFYTGLLDGLSVKMAFELGKNRILIREELTSERLRLYSRSDPDQLYLVDAAG